MAVVRGGRKEEAMFEKRRELAHSSRELGVDRPGRRSGRGGMVRFVENQHGAGAGLAEPIAKGRGILLIAQKGVGNDELRMGGPGIDRIAALTAAVEKIIPVEND